LSRLLSSESAPDSYPEADDEDKLEDDADANEVSLRNDHIYERRRWDKENIKDEPGNLNDDVDDDDDDEMEIGIVEWESCSSVSACGPSCILMDFLRSWISFSSRIRSRKELKSLINYEHGQRE